MDKQALVALAIAGVVRVEVDGVGVVGESAEAEKQRRVGREGEGKLGCGRGWVCLLAERARQRKHPNNNNKNTYP